MVTLAGMLNNQLSKIPYLGLTEHDVIAQTAHPSFDISVWQMLTGLLPPRHEVRDNMGFHLKEGHHTLAERYKAAGFATGGAVSAYVLRSQTGIAQGFDTYDDALTIDAGSESLGSLQRDGAVAVESLLRFVKGQGDKRFFAFLHLYEPHSPWAQT